MSQPRVCVLRAAGTNCDRETVCAFEAAGALAETVHINEFSRGRRRLSEFQILTIPGGFSYGDDIASGKILANEMRALIGDQVAEFIDTGRLVLGICNGFQVLVRAGLLPGQLGSDGGPFQAQVATLTDNLNGRFQCRWVRVKIDEAASPAFLKGLDGEVLEIPIAHCEGRFQAPAAVLQQLESKCQVAFRYCGPEGELNDRFNVNGSALHAAGVSGSDGRVLGLMPHPERFVSGLQHPRWTREGLHPEGAWLPFFRNAVRYAGEQ